MPTMVCHERTDSAGGAELSRDEGRPLGAGRQGQASNRRELRRSKAEVVNVVEKAGLDPVRYGVKRRAKANRR